MSCSSLVFRRPIPDDYERVMAVLPSWWDGREPAAVVPPVFFEHFRTTSLLVEHEERLVAFLVGFFCHDHAGEAYVHFAGVAPEWRRVGLGRDLYRRFCTLARAAGREVVCCVTAPADAASVAFHTALGFSMAASGEVVDGLPVVAARGPGGEPRVRFELRLGAEPAALVRPEAGA